MGVESDIARTMALCGYYRTPPASGNVYTRAFLERVMPVPEFRERQDGYYLWNDGCLNSVAGLMGGIVFIHAVLGLYRIHGSNHSDAGEVTSVAKIRKLFMRDFIREEYQVGWAKRLGLPFASDLSRFSPTVCKQRFLAYRLEPTGHPVATDTYWSLLLCGVRGAFRVPDMPILKRLYIACGFVAIGIFPRAVLRKMIGAIVTPKRRTGAVKQVGLPETWLPAARLSSGTADRRPKRIWVRILPRAT